MENAAYRLEATATGTGSGVNVMLFDKRLNLLVADGPYVYHAGLQRFGAKEDSGRQVPGTAEELLTLTAAKIAVAGDKLTIRGELAGLECRAQLTCPRIGRSWRSGSFSETKAMR